jgi:hypothetical protein
VRIVLAQDGGLELDELGAHDLEARFFEAINHSADMLLLHAVGFEDNERFLHKTLIEIPSSKDGKPDFGPQVPDWALDRHFQPGLFRQRG